MSLKVWLPLKKNTDNYGSLNDVILHSNTAIKFDEELGGGYSFNNNIKTMIQYSHTPEINKLKSFSISIYAKSLASQYLPLFSLTYSVTLYNAGFRAITQKTYIQTQKPIIQNIDTLWHNYILIFNYSTQQFLYYYDGRLINTSTWNYEEYGNFNVEYKNRIYVGRDCNNDLVTNYFNGYITDVRVYDEVLSEQQIKDLSRGLFVHYKLNQPERSENICLINTLNERVAANEFLRILENSNYKDLGVGDYTFSCYMKVAKGEPMPNIYYTDGRYDSKYKYSIPEIYTDNIKSGKLSTEYKKVIARLQFENNIENCNVLPHISIYYTYGSGQIPSVKYVKLEKGWNPNPQWTPAYSDNISWDNTEYDGSGFCNHGQLIGSVTADFTTPRYDLAYSFNNSGYIKNDNFNCTVDKCTISFWIKPKSTLSSEEQFTLGTFSEWTESGIGIWTDRGKESTPYIRYQFQLNDTNQALQTNFSWIVDTWQMITIVSDCKKCYIYRNVELIKSYDMIYDSIINPTLYLGNSRFGNINTQNSDNSMSDFRFYTSALSADDIKEIYNYRK